jgi:DNA topoisomerase-1
VGRPSTYAPTISLIQDRTYVEKDEQKRFFPTELGNLVNKILVEHFPEIVNIKFTAELEEDFDKISRGENSWTPIVKTFYLPFHKNLKIKEKEIKKEDLQKTDKICPLCKKPILLKYGRFGKFYACSGYPDCKYTEKSEEDKKLEKEFQKEKCEKCGSPMTLRHGRFGPFLGCSAYPKCKNIKSIAKSTHVKCPKCKKGELVEKRSKSKKLFYGCNQYPNCDFATWSKPIEKPCPKCKFPLTTTGKKNKCSNPDCSFQENA